LSNADLAVDKTLLAIRAALAFDESVSKTKFCDDKAAAPYGLTLSKKWTKLRKEASEYFEWVCAPTCVHVCACVCVCVCVCVRACE